MASFWFFRLVTLESVATLFVVCPCDLVVKWFVQTVLSSRNCFFFAKSLYIDTLMKSLNFTKIFT